MKTLNYVLFCFILALASAHAQYPKVSVKDIMTLPTDSLAIPSLLSPKYGDTVWVVGTVAVPPLVDVDNGDRRPLITNLTRAWGAFLHDTDATLNLYSGVYVQQSDTTTKAQFTLFDKLHKYDVVEILCRVTNNPNNRLNLNQNRKGSTQLEVITTSVAGSPINTISKVGALPTAIVPLNITDFYNGTTANIATGSQYVGSKVELSDVIVQSAVYSATTRRTTIIIRDTQKNTMYLNDLSGYFTTAPTQLAPFSAWVAGQKLKTVRGYITSISIGGGIGGTAVSFTINPMFADDVVLGSAPPAITSVTSLRPNAFPTPTETVNIAFTVRKGDSDFDDTKSKLMFAFNNGKYDTLTATRVNDTTYSATIPATTANTTVRYRTTATDLGGITVYNPTAALYYYYKVLNRDPKIADVRRTLSTDGSSNYVGYPVTITGIVTADVSDFPGNGYPRIYIQDTSAAYSGLFLQTSNLNDPLRALKRGDKIRVTGTVAELGDKLTKNYRNTALTTPVLVDLAGDGGIISHGNTMATVRLTVAQMTGKLLGDSTADRYQGMLVEFQTAIVKDTNSDAKAIPPANYGDFDVYQGGGGGGGGNTNATIRVDTQDGNTSLTTLDNVSGKSKPVIGTRYTFIHGIWVYGNGFYKVVPRQEDDLAVPLGVDYSPIISPEFNLTAYPNPFNNQTTISFSLEKEGLTTVFLSTLNGEILQTLMNEVLPTGTYGVTVNGSQLSSGTYLCTIRTQSGTISQKLVLIR